MGKKRAPHIICWDLEVLTPVTSWESARAGGSGCSCVVLSSSETGRLHLYTPAVKQQNGRLVADYLPLDEVVDHLNQADLLVGWNTTGFDTEVLENLLDRQISAPQYDILAAVWESLGHREKGWKLGDVALRTLGLDKNGSGASAPELAHRGEWGKLLDYCSNDVYLVQQLWNHIVDNRCLPAPDGGTVRLTPPYEDYA